MSVDEPDPRSGGSAAARPAGGWTRDWRVALGVGLLVLILVVWAGASIRTQSLYARLLRTEGDKTEQDPALVRFATVQGKAVFAKTCASCHGPQMKGDPSRGVPNLTDNDWLYGSGRVAELEQTILYGIRSGHPRAWNLADMPAFGQAVPYSKYKVGPLTPGQIRDLVEYIQLIEGKPADAAAAARGSPLYADTGQCFDCHATDGAGDAAIGAPNLLDNIWLYGDGSKQSLFKSIAGGHRGVCPSWAGRLSAGKIRALAVYIHTNAAKPRPAAPAQATAEPNSREKQS